ncbi:uncharacterized protein UDID_17649 [Ustilago sp. UG-2017a]|nr:uncharacterized protein UDID_17649 [Ustilago sp. UG-2017a]
MPLYSRRASQSLVTVPLLLLSRGYTDALPRNVARLHLDNPSSWRTTVVSVGQQQHNISSLNGSMYSDTDTQKQDQVMSLKHTLQDQHVPGVTDQTTLHTK